MSGAWATIWLVGVMVARAGWLLEQVPSERVSVVTADGKVNCGGDAFSQVPEHPDSLGDLLALERWTNAMLRVRPTSIRRWRFTR